MKLEDLNKEYGLYKSIDLLKDQRINIFCKAGGGLVYFSLLIIGFFLSNQTLFFKFENNPAAFIQYTLLIICFIVYSIIHEFTHYISARILKINAKWIKDGLSPFVSLEGVLIKQKDYYKIILSPLIALTIILIPLQIIIMIFVPDWFWLPWTIIMQHFASSLTDIVAFFYTKQYKNAFIEDANIKICVYIPKDKFPYYHEIEKNYYSKKIENKIKKEKRKEQFKNAPKLGKEKYLNEYKEKNDIDDLTKLDK